MLAILGLGLMGSVPFFRPKATTPELVRRSSGDDLTLRGVPLQVATQSSHSPAVGLHDDDTGSGQSASATKEGQRFPAGLDQFGPPPEFNSSYPGVLDPVEKWTNRSRPEDVYTRVSPSIRPASAEGQVVDSDSPRRHRIIDGDTLSRLARKYLGDASRAGEIYDANRDVLTTPAVLPLGVEIVIPVK